MLEKQAMKILETENLILRHFEVDDLNDLFRLYSDPEVRRYFPDGTRDWAYTKEELEYYLNGHPDHPELGLWATIHKQSKQFIGRCGLLPWTIDGRFEVEVAYLLDKAYWGQGLGTEAAQAVLDYGFEHLQLSRLICIITPGNVASVKVALRIGMVFERETEDELGPFLLYARSRPQNGQ